MLFTVIGVEGCLLWWPLSTFPSYSTAINYILAHVAMEINSWWFNCTEKEKAPDINLAMIASLYVVLLIPGTQPQGRVQRDAVRQLSPKSCPYVCACNKHANSTSLRMQWSKLKGAELLNGERRTHEQLPRLSWCDTLSLNSSTRLPRNLAVKAALHNLVSSMNFGSNFGTTKEVITYGFIQFRCL